MKLSFAALAIATMTGSASAGLIFNPPVPFTQYNGDCETGTVLYKGNVDGIKMIENASFCISESLEGEENTAYSRVDIVECTADKIYENWFTCEDSECKDCGNEYKAYTSWESIDPENLVGYCYDYTFSADEQPVSATRKTGTFNEVRQINYNFDADADPEDAMMYVKMMDDNSCIAAGRPTDSTGLKQASEDNIEDHSGEDHSDNEDVAESGASALAASAAVAMAVATTMLLA